MRKILLVAIFSLLASYAWVGNVTLIAPENASWTNKDNNTLAFQFMVYGNETTACALWLSNVTGTWYLAGLNGSVLANTTTTLYANFSLAENYVYGWHWYLNCSNSTTGMYAESEEWIFYVDRTPPSISFVSPTTLTGNYSRNYIEVNISASDSGLLENITFYLYNSTGLVNISVGKGPYVFFNFTGLPEDVYYINATANDTAGNENYTETRKIILDKTPPSVSFSSPTTSEGLNSQSYIEVTVSASDTPAGVSTITICLYRSDSLVECRSGTGVSLSENFTSLEDGEYSVNITVNDTAGNTNSSLSRSFVLDTHSPSIDFITQNKSTQYVISTYRIDFTISDPHLESCWYSEDGGANVSFDCSSPLTLSAGTAGLHVVAIYANDTLGHLAKGEIFVNVQFKRADGSSCTSAVQCIGGYCVHGYCSSQSTYCGDGYCEKGETYLSCPLDCPSPVSRTKTIWGDIRGSRTVWVNEGQKRKLYVRVSKVPVTTVEITPEVSGYTQVTVEAISAKEIEKPLSKGYSYFSLKITLPASEIRIHFAINKSWLEENNIQPTEVKMFKFVNGEWDPLETYFVEEKAGKIYYKARVRGTSLFAIGVEKEVTQQAPIEKKPEPVKEEVKVPKNVTEIEEERGISIVWVLFVVVGIVALLLSVREWGR